jgi:hypothetical protein
MKPGQAMPQDLRARRSEASRGYWDDEAYRQRVTQRHAERRAEGYQREWEEFLRWCAVRGYDALPALPETVAAYLSERAEVLKSSAIRRRAGAIRANHEGAGLVDPTAKLTP